MDNKQENQVRRIKNQYMGKENTKMDELKLLDKKVKRPANVFGYVFGSIGAIIMGAGMSLVMTDVGASIGVESAMIPGIVVGCIGMLMATINYPIYKKILSSRRKKYAGRIVELSEEIMCTGVQEK